MENETQNLESLFNHQILELLNKRNCLKFDPWESIWSFDNAIEKSA